MDRIQFDPNKRKSNLKKHNRDFLDAPVVLNRKEKVNKIDGRKDYGETREITVAKGKKNRLASVVHTKRGDEERIISFRDANYKEKSWWGSIWG